MGQTATAPAPHGVASFDILLDDKAMDATFQVLSVTVVSEINRIPFAKMVIRDGDASAQTFSVSSKEFFIGKKIRIRIGNDSSKKQVFSGLITKHSIKIREKGTSELHIEC